MYTQAWFGRFTQVLYPWGTSTVKVITPLFIKHSCHGKLTLLLYVFDMVIARDHDIEKQILSKKQAIQFEMMELGT